MLTADCVTNSFSAAALSLRSWCTATKARSWRMVGLKLRIHQEKSYFVRNLLIYE